MIGTVVISGAVAAIRGATPVSLLSVPEVLELAILETGQGVQLVIHNLTAAALTAALDGGDAVCVAPADSAAVALRSTPDGDRLHLQLLFAEPPRAVTAIVTVELSDDGPIAVGQAIGTEAL